MTKICTKCGQDKDESSYTRCKRGKSGLESSCKDCKREYQRANYRANKAVKAADGIAYDKVPCPSCGKPKGRQAKTCRTCISKSSRRRGADHPSWKGGSKFILYGITEDDYNRLLEAQDKKCAICRKEETILLPNGTVKPLSIDHCHQTGKVRGLLCQRCNGGLGMFGDSVESLLSAAMYLNSSHSHLPNPN